MPESVVLLHAGCTRRWPGSDRQQAIEHALRAAVDHARSMLQGKAAACEVAVEVVTMLEDCELFNAGKGAALTVERDHELEAGVVDGSSGKYGAVACTRSIKNPVRAAHHLLAHGPHSILVGAAADAMAAQNGLETVANHYFTTNERRLHLDEHSSDDFLGLGTVGVVVLDHKGSLAAAGSTGGVAGKAKGRIGDTAILGAGLYADSELAAVCSGAGDAILRNMTATKLRRHFSGGLMLAESSYAALSDPTTSRDTCAILALNAQGHASIASNARSFSIAMARSTGPIIVSIWPATSTIAPQSILYRDDLVLAGLTTYPSTPGHTKVELRRREAHLLSLNVSELTHVMLVIKEVAIAVSQACDTRRCALVTTGSNAVSLLPLHGLDAQWKPVTSAVKDFHDEYHGYITSHDGPAMSADDLCSICRRIQDISGTQEPFNHTFEGPNNDSNLFARIVRGEISQYRVWEDDEHVAFLTPFANTEGFTVLVPRSHLSSDVFSLDDRSYTKLVIAAKKVAQILTEALGVPRCGMIFEGFEIDYAHVKLIPIHTGVASEDVLAIPEAPAPGEYYKTYMGFVTSLDGPDAANLSDLSSKAADIQLKLPRPSFRAPRSWNDPLKQFSKGIQEPWYECVLALQDTLFHRSCDYFRKALGYKYALVPATADAISSPMGLGSDSEPVQIQLLGQDTHLADSMQFALEYFLRIGHGLPGAYYVGCSFRGEDPDSMHLNQFYHVECELVGDFANGLHIAEMYIATMVTSLLKHHGTAIQQITGSLDHMHHLLKYYDDHKSSFPQVTLDEALAFPFITHNCWKHVVAEQPDKGKALTREGERALIRHFGGPVWLTEMNHLSVPFYQAYKDCTHVHARCADLLLGIGETLGLGERHYTSKDVTTALHEHQVEVGPYDWYCKMRDLKPLQTIGWGMGTERFLAWVLQHDDIRDIAIIPRLKGSRFAP